MPPPPTEVFASRLFLGPALRAQPDRRLVTLVREGYEAAFEEIVRRYGRPLARYAASIVGSRSEDVTQDAFSKALLALRRDENEIDLRPWLYRIVRNTALNDLRDRPPTPEILEEAIAAGHGTAAAAEEREELRELIERLQALPERQRAAIVMRELEGLSHEEIAASLGLSGGAARQVIFRARETLRSGAGMLLPLPLLRIMLEHGTEATAGAGAAGMLAAGGAGGAGTALKAGAVAVILAGSVGTGIALQHDHGNGERADAAILSGQRGAENGSGASARPAASSAGSTTGSESGGDSRGHDGQGSGSGGGVGSTDDRAEGHSGPDRGGSGTGGGGSVGTSHGGPGPDGPRNSGPGSGGAMPGPGSGDRGESDDRHGSGSGSSGESSGPSGGGSDDNSGTDGGVNSGDDGFDGHSGTDGGSATTEPAPDESTSGSDGGGSSGEGSGGELESGSEFSQTDSSEGGDDSVPPPTS